MCTTTGVMVQTVQFLDRCSYSARSLTRPLCTTTGVMVPTVQPTNASSWLVVYMPVVVQMTPTNQWVRQWRKLWFRSCFPLTRWSTSSVCRSCRFNRCRCGGDSRLPQLQLLRNPSRFRTCSWTRSLTRPLWCQRQGSWSRRAVPGQGY